jgi:uncharacterized phiE125 gp8 family phage protein
MRSVVVITPPNVPAVSLPEAKAHLRVDHDDDDGYISGLVAVATATFDGPEGWLGLALVKQTLELRLDGFPGCRHSFFYAHGHSSEDTAEIRLPYPPLLGGVSVSYTDAEGADQTLAAPTYRVVGSGGRGVARLALAYSQVWPYTRYQREAVRIRYDAGYGTAGADVPAPLRHAILLTVGHLYENRQAVVVDASRVQALELPQGVEALVSPYRVWSA